MRPDGRANRGELAFGSAVLMGRAGATPMTDAEQERMVDEGLKEVTMHEIGHTLGLRHNFKASTELSLEDINNPDKVKETGMGASVMDYYPVNIVPSGVRQGNFYSPTIGAYDMWAIEYGYKPINVSDPAAEEAGLEQDRLAQRRAGAGLFDRRRHPRHRSRSAIQPLRHGQRRRRLRQAARQGRGRGDGRSWSIR